MPAITVRSTVLFALILILLQFQVAGQSKKSSPRFHLNMETLEVVDQKNLGEFSCDSLIKGIKGNAFSFGPEAGKKTFAIIDGESSLPQIWTGDFSVTLWVSTKAVHKKYEVLATNKVWNNGYIKDYTTNAAFGISRTTGSNKGWAIISQPDGSWAWNIGDGKQRLDYRPTAPRQQINDGMWHQIAFTVSRTTNEAYLYFDGINVGIYNIKGFGNLGDESTLAFATDILAEGDAPAFQGALDEFKVFHRAISADEVAEAYSQLVPAAKLPKLSDEPVKTLNLMAWNIWHGGRRHGREIGPKQVIDFIKNTGTEIVMMQETYGSGALIADALGYYFYLASTNISVLSKYPILTTKAPYDSFRLGMTTVALSKGQKINLASLWIHYLPDWRSNVRAQDATPKKIVLGEGATRHKEIKEILELVQPEIANADEIPLIIGGDYNSPSFRDWTKKTKQWHNNMAIEWPVSKEMAKAGFADSFREIRPNLDYGAPTMSAERLTYRIDYIYYMGKKLRAIDSDMHFNFKGAWPSDHPAVTTTLAIESE